MTQSVIVYNSITQQRLDEIVSNSEYTFPIMVAAFIFIICVPLLFKPVEKILKFFVKDRETVNLLASPITLIISWSIATTVFVSMV